MTMHPASDGVEGVVVSTHPAIRWPDGLAPADAHVHTVNVLEVPLAPAQLWPWLVRATRWPDYYDNARRIRLAGDAAELAPGLAFRWWTFGVPVRTVVDDLVPHARLAWRGAGLGARGYHAWILEPIASGTRVTTEETQRGAAVWLGRPLLRRGLLRWHQRWIEGLAVAASLGHPDHVSRATVRAHLTGATS